jgi:hypothetical protein
VKVAAVDQSHVDRGAPERERGVKAAESAADYDYARPHAFRLAVEASDAVIDRAVRRSDFAELQRQEKAHGFRERTSRNAPFFRVGRAGAWREVLTEDQVRAIEDRHAAVMTRMGYLRGSRVWITGCKRRLS